VDDDLDVSLVNNLSVVHHDNHAHNFLNCLHLRGNSRSLSGGRVELNPSGLGRESYIEFISRAFSSDISHQNVLMLISGNVHVRSNLDGSNFTLVQIKMFDLRVDSAFRTTSSGLGVLVVGLGVLIVRLGVLVVSLGVLIVSLGVLVVGLGGLIVGLGVLIVSLGVLVVGLGVLVVGLGAGNGLNIGGDNDLEVLTVNDLSVSLHDNRALNFFNCVHLRSDSRGLSRGRVEFSPGRLGGESKLEFISRALGSDISHDNISFVAGVDEGSNLDRSSLSSLHVLRFGHVGVDSAFRSLSGLSSTLDFTTRVLGAAIVKLGMVHDTSAARFRHIFSALDLRAVGGIGLIVGLGWLIVRLGGLVGGSGLNVSGDNDLTSIF